ncbi:extensin-like [Arachis ipaensis]|uniref:extensin-like n=1 Tax=Arachis ipaensis TaxID=130454 RepID=UPI0007AF885A|nr:extensin-like [Arachis ipaensis]XP_025635804.1 extensin-like [Arachis hypogaea]
MRKKIVSQKPPREKIYRLPAKQKPSTRSQDRTFTPSPSPLTSPPRSDPMARTKNPSRFTPLIKQTPPPKELPSKPGSSKLSSSKGKRPAVTEPTFEPTQPKIRSVPLHSQKGKPRLPLKSVREPDIDAFAHKSHFMTSHSNHNPYRFKSAMNNDFYERVIKYHTLCPSFLADLPNL